MQVKLDGSLGDIEFARNYFVGKPLGGKKHDLALAHAQPPWKFHSQNWRLRQADGRQWQVVAGNLGICLSEPTTVDGK